MAEHDNNNRVSLWMAGKAALAGRGDVNGQPCRCYLMSSGAQADKAPTHKLFIEFTDGSATVVALWRDADDKPSWASGKYRDTHWVNVYKGDSQSANGPLLRVQFKEIVQQQPQGDAAQSDQPAQVAAQPTAASILEDLG